MDWKTYYRNLHLNLRWIWTVSCWTMKFEHHCLSKLMAKIADFNNLYSVCDRFHFRTLSRLNSYAVHTSHYKHECSAWNVSNLKWTFCMQPFSYLVYNVVQVWEKKTYCSISYEQAIFNIQTNKQRQKKNEKISKKNNQTTYKKPIKISNSQTNERKGNRDSSHGDGDTGRTPSSSI